MKNLNFKIHQWIIIKILGDFCVSPIWQGVDRLQSCSRIFLFLQGNNGTRLIRMNQAAELYLIQIVEKGSLVGMVTFDSTATIQNNLIRMINESSYLEISANLPREASGGTSICNGLRKGFEVKKRKLITITCHWLFLTFSKGCEFLGYLFNNFLTWSKQSSVRWKRHPFPLSVPTPCPAGRLGKPRLQLGTITQRFSSAHSEAEA